MKDTVKAFPGEVGKFRKEARDHFKLQYWAMEHGDYKYVWKLNNQKAIDEWVSDC